jgi:TonB family protein
MSADFVARLVNELRNSYSEREAAFVGLAAQLEFTLTTDGSLTKACLLESSGSAEFDQAVISTIHRVKVSGFPPNTAGKTFRVRFRVPNGT